MPDTWRELRKHLQAGEERVQQRWLGLRGCCSHKRGHCLATGRDTAVPQLPQGGSVPPLPLRGKLKQTQGSCTTSSL